MINSDEIAEGHLKGYKLIRRNRIFWGIITFPIILLLAVLFHEHDARVKSDGYDSCDRVSSAVCYDANCSTGSY